MREFKEGDTLFIADAQAALDWNIPKGLVDTLSLRQSLTVSEINEDTGEGPSVCLQEDEFNYNWPVSALAHAPATYANTQSLHVQGRLKSDEDKWFDLFYLAMSQGHTIDKSAEMADHAYFEYEKRVNGR